MYSEQQLKSFSGRNLDIHSIIKYANFSDQFKPNAKILSFVLTKPFYLYIKYRLEGESEWNTEKTIGHSAGDVYVVYENQFGNTKLVVLSNGTYPTTYYGSQSGIVIPRIINKSLVATNLNEHKHLLPHLATDLKPYLLKNFNS